MLMAARYGSARAKSSIGGNAAAFPTRRKREYPG